MGEKWWESALAGIGLVGSILVLTALLLMVAPPDETIELVDCVERGGPDSRVHLVRTDTETAAR